MDDSVKRKNVERVFRHGTRGESAKRCIGTISHNCDVFGLTKGDFSMIDILRHVLSEIGPCRIDIGTWTAASADIKSAFDLLERKDILGMRWMVDRSFPNRQRAYYEALLSKFGKDSVRLARFHAKFILMENENYSVAVRTSMNLNMNKRIEFYEISEGSPISDYLRQIVDYHFGKPSEDSYSAFKNLRIGENDAKMSDDSKKKLGEW